MKKNRIEKFFWDHVAGIIIFVLLLLTMFFSYMLGQMIVDLNF